MADIKYFAKLNGAEKGPMTLAQLGRSDIDAKTPVRTDADTEWRAAGDIPAVKKLMEVSTEAPVFGMKKYEVSIIGGGFLNTTNGKLLLFDDYCTVAPNVGASVMLGNFSKSGYKRNHFGYEEIAAIKSGFMAKWSLTLTDGSVVKLSSMVKKKVFDELERRRAHWFTSRGLEVAPLDRD